MDEWTLLLWFLAGMFVGQHITISYSQAYRNSRNMIDTAIAREREACAKLCDELQDYPTVEARHCAEEIRARGQA
jgi:hypothetical protein